MLIASQTTYPWTYLHIALLELLVGNVSINFTMFVLGAGLKSHTSYYAD